MNDDLLDADWSAHESALLGSAELDVAPEGSSERTLAALGLGVALGVSGAALTAASVPAKAAAANGLAVWLKWAAALLAGAGAVGAVVVALRQSPVAPASTPHAPTSAAPVATPAASSAPNSKDEPASPSLASREASSEPVVGSEHVSGVRPPPRPPQAKVAMAEELRVIDEARRLLRAGNAPAALVKLVSYDVMVGAHGGRLRAEASVVRIEALKANGRRREASLLCRQFLAEHPRSPYAAHVKRLLATVTAVPD